MTRHLALFLALLLTVRASPPPGTALSWDTRLISASAQPGKRVVHASFGFRNSSSAPVAIIAVETSCRCTSADSDKRIYVAGERGRIDVAFAIGAQEGLQEKSVTVSTDEPGVKDSILVLRVAIAPAD
ncbi:MAG TPA: DUF1573 domain-containing protein [Opitutaceae bacterium]|jgi:hypothetical protein|nr:DUF1573 domain-containing protein [Opitutaceae bacterium]